MTAKEAFRLADSIMRYYDLYLEYDFQPRYFDGKRDFLTELQMIPDNIIGACYRYHLADGAMRKCQWYAGRIMEMYNEKIYDRDMLARGWHVQRPDGYGVVAGKTVLKRIPMPTVRMT